MPSFAPRALLRASLLMFFAVLILEAQYRAVLQGTVTDPSGAEVPGAAITVTNVDTNVSHSATTSGSGSYSVPGLSPGHYSVAVDATGFAKKTVDVVIASEQPQSQNVKLDLAQQTTQTVTVNGGAPPIDTETGNISGTLSSQQIEDLPTFGRDPFQAVQLAPGAFGENSRSANGSNSQSLPGNAGPGGTSGTQSIFQTENQVQVSANGNRTNSNDFQIDGVEVNSLAWGGAAVITPNKESIKEVTIQSNPYDAENGRNSGAQVLVVSKSGTNEYHGSALWKADRPGLNAYQRWNGPNGDPVLKDTDRFNQWAGSLGGPIIKNHLFAFFSYETIRNQSVQTSSSWFETPQFINTVKAAAPNSIAAKVLGYPGEGAAYSYIIPQTCGQIGITNSALCQVVNDSSGKYLGLDVGSPLKSALGTQDPGYVNNGNFGAGGGLDGIPDVFFVETANPVQSNPQQFNGRLDYQATSKDLIAFSAYVVPVTTTSYNGPVRSANLWHNDRQNESAALLWDRTITPTWFNEARVNVTRWSWNEVSSNPQEPWGLPTLTTDQFAGVSLQNLGAPGPTIFNQTTYNVRDTVNHAFGKHSLKMGFDIYKEQDGDNLSSSARPTFDFRNIWSLANDAPYQEVGNFDPTTGAPSSATKYIRSNIYAGFIQDEYKLLPNLTLNLGLRWEYFTPITEKYGNISNVVLGSEPDPLTGLSLKVGGDLYSSSTNNWGPQVGFAWSPNPASSRFVVRGGFGIGYNRMEEAVTLNGRSNPPLVTGLTLNGSNVSYQTPADVHQFAGWPSNPNAIQAINPSTNLPLTGSPVTITGFPQSLPTPVTDRYSLGIDSDLGKSWVMKLGYQGSTSHHLTIQNNLNFLYSPLNPEVGQLYYFSNTANSNYNAFLAEAQHRFSQSFEIDTQYRWSKAIDEGSNDYFIDQYPFNRAASRGPADFDVTHNVKVWGLWGPKIAGNHGFLGKVAGGWQLSGIMNWNTGFPWTPLYANTSCNVVYQNSGYCQLRPANYLGGMGTDFSNSTFQRANGNFPNGALAYFTVPTFPTTGIPAPPAVGRNVLRGPQFLGLDASIQKSFGLPKMPVFGEGARLEVRMDAFNVFNKLNLAPMTNNVNDQIISFDGTTSNPLFGQAQSALNGRIIELQARFSF